jgi:hypothetical protein
VLPNWISRRQVVNLNTESLNIGPRGLKVNVPAVRTDSGDGVDRLGAYGYAITNLRLPCERKLVCGIFALSWHGKS